MTAVEKSKLVTSILALVEAHATNRGEALNVLGASYLMLRTPELIGGNEFILE